MDTGSLRGTGSVKLLLSKPDPPYYVIRVLVCGNALVGKELCQTTFCVSGVVLARKGDSHAVYTVVSEM